MNLTEQEIFRVANSNSKQEALSLIKTQANDQEKHPNHQPTESQLWRDDIEAELTFNLIDYGLRKGFTLSAVSKFLKIQSNLVQSIRGRSENAFDSCNLGSFWREFYENLNQLTTADDDDMNEEKTLKEFIDYAKDDLFKNFNLISYVFNYERDNSIMYEVKSIVVPDRKLRKENYTLSENAKPYDVWVEDEKLYDLAKREAALRENFYSQQKKLIADEDEIAKNLLKFINNDAYGKDEPLDKKMIEKLIDEISEPMLNTATKLVKLELDTLRDKVKLNEEKKELIKLEEKTEHKNKSKVSSPKKN